MSDVSCEPAHVPLPHAHSVRRWLGGCSPPLEEIIEGGHSAINPLPLCLRLRLRPGRC
jgi:hypothetical protein